jgi:hypothetical protein
MSYVVASFRNDRPGSDVWSNAVGGAHNGARYLHRPAGL